jgi:predicted transcriptional regulator
MTVKELSEHQAFESVTMPQPEREIKNVYIGDLLSWVMGKAQENDAWITIMNNVNVIAVASLADVSCVIFSEGVVPSEDIIKTAEEKGINILSSPLPSYETAVKISGMI